MPVSLNANPSPHDRSSCAKGLCNNPSAKCLERSSKSLHIGLINNMPDGALEATERQFLSLLQAASTDISIRLSLYSLPKVPRNELGARHIREFYSSTENLTEIDLDGLIVTGREPLTPNLADEPYWGGFTKILEWSQNHTYSTVWSCLAAHAAVLHLDGIRRFKNGRKQCGIFDCTQLTDHPLIAGAPSHYKLPHSRWNGLAEDELTRSGYQVLTRAADAGVDTFMKQGKSLFVFFQGHPEYEPNTLLLEYRRDVARYLRGETNKYPSMPRDYFDQDAVTALTVLEQEALVSPPEASLAKITGLLEKLTIENTWRSTAVCIYRNWLQYICAQKKLQLESSVSVARSLAPKGVPASSVFTQDILGQDKTSVPSYSILPIL